MSTATLDPTSATAQRRPARAVPPARRPGFTATLRSERIKLFSTRSPWWCALVAAVISIGFGALVTAEAMEGTNRIYFSLAGLQFAQVLVIVMSTIAITSEYRFGTLRTTFQATASRTRVLWTKAALVSSLAFVLGEVIAFATYGLARLISDDPGLMITSVGEWRLVAGHGLVYACAALIGLGVGAMVRQTDGAISLLLVWTLLVETLVVLIPGIGADIVRYLPFQNATIFAGDQEMTAIVEPLDRWTAFGLFAGTAMLVMAAATVVVRRRDA